MKTHPQTLKILANQPKRIERRIATIIFLLAVGAIYSGVLQQYLQYKAPEIKKQALAQKYNPNADVEKAEKQLALIKQLTKNF